MSLRISCHASQLPSRGEFCLEVPKIPAHCLQVLSRDETEFLLCHCRVGRQIRDIAKSVYLAHVPMWLKPTKEDRGVVGGRRKHAEEEE
jgi:hypothetical protein